MYISKGYFSLFLLNMHLNKSIQGNSLISAQKFQYTILTSSSKIAQWKANALHYQNLHCSKVFWKLDKRYMFLYDNLSLERHSDTPRRIQVHFWNEAVTLSSSHFWRRYFLEDEEVNEGASTVHIISCSGIQHLSSHSGQWNCLRWSRWMHEID